MLLEGPDIRALLQQVQEEHGPNARIVHAERVRSGGVGGFFAKQRFEVTVEVDGDSAGTDAAAGAALPQTVLPQTVRPEASTPRAVVPDAADLAEQFRRTDEQAAADTRPALQGSVARGGAAAAAEPLPLSPVDSLLAAVDRADSPAPRRAPSLVPAALTDPVAPAMPAMPAMPAPAPAPGPVAATPILEEARRAAGIDPRLLTPVGPAAADAEATPLSDLVGWLQTQQDALAEAGAARAAEQPMPQQPSPGVDPAVLAGIVARAGLAGLNATVPAAEAPATPAPAAAPAPSGTPIADALLAAPAAPSMATVTPLPGIDRALAAPAAPRAPRRPGDVLVLLGEPGAAHETARTLAASLRIPADRVRVVSHDAVVPGVAEEAMVRDVLEARLAGAQLALERTPGVVVVDAPLGLVADAHGCDWVADMLDALRPAAVWAVVDATRRHDDLVRWLGCLPEVDALAAHAVAVTTDPEAVHRLGVPVAMVDGRPVAAPAPAVDAAAPVSRRRTS